MNNVYKFDFVNEYSNLKNNSSSNDESTIADLATLMVMWCMISSEKDNKNYCMNLIWVIALWN